MMVLTEELKNKKIKTHCMHNVVTHKSQFCYGNNKNYFQEKVKICKKCLKMIERISYYGPLLPSIGGILNENN